MYRIKGKIEALSRNRFCSGKTVTITYSECVFLALDIQRVKFMHMIQRVKFMHMILSFVVCSTVPRFFTLSHKLRDFQGGKNFENKMCFGFLYSICLKRFSLFQKNSTKYCRKRTWLLI
jgi:hypothetical protein